MVKQSVTSLLHIKQQLQSCGYSDDFLREGYRYEDSDGAHEVPLACFSNSICDSRSSCISVLQCDDVENVTEKFVDSYRGIGTPVVFVCGRNNIQWWVIKASGAEYKKTIANEKIPGFINKNKTRLAPDSIWRAKNLGRIDASKQLGFVDVGLMPAIEKREGEYLADLMIRTLDMLWETRNISTMTDGCGRWLFQAAFWLTGAKILKDKQVQGFKTLKISDIESLVNRVQRHYGAAGQLDISKATQRNSLTKVAREIIEPVYSLSHITTESLAYVYENALVSKKTRKALGTHATPSWLVNYIVWQMADWIEEIPQQERVIFEPTCGHAPFLIAGAKLLSFLYDGRDEDKHDYLKSHLIGIERDPFAIEIARLGLTLADIPNRNGWKVLNADVYENNQLKELAQNSTILLCNPPFEWFTKEEKQRYEGLETGNKAAEVLKQTLPYMRDGSVFGVVLQQGFLHRRELAELRKFILDNFELREICNLPDNVFAKAGLLSTVLIGRKKKSYDKVSYVQVSKSKLQTFIDSYQSPKFPVPKEDFYEAKYFSFRVPTLKEVWGYCKEYPVFEEFATVGRGIEYKNFEKSIQKKNFAGAVKGYGRFEKHVTKAKKTKKVDVKITDLPDEFWMSLRDEDISNWRYGYQPGVPQVIANYARSGSDCWRIKGLIESHGKPITNSFIAIRPNQGSQLTLHLIWAFLNSSLTNAYMFCFCMERHNMEGVLRSMPIPSNKDFTKLEDLAKNYFALTEKTDLEAGCDVKYEAKKLLLSIDAEVMRLYDFPPRHEKKILDLFQGIRRKGVDFEFSGYYPEGFESAIPLHEYLSEEYQNSTFEHVNKWVKKNRSDAVIKAFETAVDAFQD